MSYILLELCLISDLVACLGYASIPLFLTAHFVHFPVLDSDMKPTLCECLIRFYQTSRERGFPFPIPYYIRTPLLLVITLTEFEPQSLAQLPHLFSLFQRSPRQ